MSSIHESLNPKFISLGLTAQVLWETYYHIKDHKTHQFYYSIKTLMSLIGHGNQAIINGNKELESLEIISRITEHRKTTIYKLNEKRWLKQGDSSFLLIPDSNSSVWKSHSDGVKITSNSVWKSHSTECENHIPSNDLSEDLSNNLSCDVSHPLGEENRMMEQLFVKMMMESKEELREIYLDRFVKIYTANELVYCMNRHKEYDYGVLMKRNEDLNSS